MKKLICLLTIFLLCVVCVSSVSAFTYTDEATVNPKGSLSPGESVVVSMSITFPTGSSGGDVTLNTDLTDAVWSLDYYSTSKTGSRGPKSLDVIYYGSNIKLSAWSLIYNDETIDVSIALSGKVPAANMLAESSIKAMTITQLTVPSGEHATYSTPNQKVYNPDNFDSDVAAIETQISAIEPRIIAYANYSIDVSQAESYVSTAKTKLNAAKSYGKADITNAYANIEDAEKQLTNAERYLAGSALNFIKANTDQIKADIATLEEKGWKSEAALLAASNQQIINLYTIAKNTYDAGSVPDVDQNLIDSFSTLDKANKYVEDALKNPLAGILSYWWVLLIVVGVAAVVAGIIFFIKRRGSSWDELG